MGAERLGIVVLSYGAGGDYRQLLDELLGEGIDPAAITLVHNPASPGEAAGPAPDGCDVVEADRNFGYAGGMNIGIERRAGQGDELLLLLTHDARLRAGALGSLLDAAARRPGFGVLAPALVLAGTDTPFSFGGITRANGSNAHLRERPVGGEEVVACDWVDGGTMLIRCAAIEAAGAFDERFWGYFEEADLCLRVRRTGAAVGVVPAAVADQEPGGAKRPGPWAYLLTRNGIEYARRARGARGAAAMILRSLWNLAYELVRMGVRGAGLRHGAAAEPRARAHGTARGLGDWLRGRWGPPPPDLPGMGDLRNA